MIKSLKKTLLVQILLSVLCLFLPFVYMKIGPKGYEFYGPDCPDIYILGGYILGKDVSWWGINFAYKFQLALMILYIAIAIFSYKNITKLRLIFYLQFVCIILLLGFPFWVFFYQDHVQNNSDGADLTVYPHVGWFVYIGLVYIQVMVFKFTNRILQKKDPFIV